MLHKESDEAKRQLTKQGIAIGMCIVYIITTDIVIAKECNYYSKIRKALFPVYFSSFYPRIK